jgi:hypothetical protein
MYNKTHCIRAFRYERRNEKEFDQHDKKSSHLNEIVALTSRISFRTHAGQFVYLAA